MSLLRYTAILASGVVALSSQPACSAEISIINRSKAGVVIEVSGDITQGDDEKFRSIASANPKAIVVLRSDGGAIVPAMDIGRTIRLREYTTAVYKGDTCASACALIWMAGQRRVIFNGGKVGFHASYTDENGQLIETGVGNALVGHYLTQLGFGEQTIVFATMAAPDKILWLDNATASGSGIDYQQIPITADGGSRGESGSRTQYHSGDRPPPPIRVSPNNSLYGSAKQTVRSVDEFASALKAKGFRAEVDDSDPKSPSILTGIDGHNISISFSSCVKHDCNYIELIGFWTGASYESALVVMQKWGLEEHYSSLIYLPKDSSVATYHYIVLGSDGITATNLFENLSYFAKEFAQTGQLLNQVK